MGEVANFAAYTFAPPILVTPLGALSVLIGAVLASFILKEELGVLGKLGCAICLIGSVIIVLHAPADKEVSTVNEILDYAMQPGFLAYTFLVVAFASFMIYKVAPIYGRRTPLVYISICSTVGSLSVMAIKAFGIALKLTLAGNNQFIYPSTYLFAITVGFCIFIQMTYFNKALDTFSTSHVNPLYYVTFTSATLCASFILFKGFNTTDSVNTISLLCGFLVIFSGVYLLNMSQSQNSLDNTDVEKMLGEIPMDSGVGAGTLQVRRSLQLRRSLQSSRVSSHQMYTPTRSPISPHGPNNLNSNRSDINLMGAFESDEEERFGMNPLHDNLSDINELVDDSDADEDVSFSSHTRMSSLH